MNAASFSPICDVGIYWYWTPTSWRVCFFNEGTRLPLLKAVVDDFGSLVVVP